MTFAWGHFSPSAPPPDNFIGVPVIWILLIVAAIVVFWTPRD